MSRLDRALAALDRAMGWSTEARELERVEVGRDGTLFLTARAEAGARWFAFAEEQLQELLPREDARVPLCKSEASAGNGIVSWRPGRRICLSGIWKGEACYLKGYRRKRSERAARNHERVASACWRAGTFAVPGVLQHDRGSDALTLSAVPGTPLSVKATRSPAFFRVGRAIGMLQRDVEIEGLEHHGTEQELAVLEDLARRVEPTLGGLPEGWEEAAARLAATDPPDGPSVACHRDLHDGQLLGAPNAVGLLDFDLLCAGHPLLDLGNLTAHLRLRALQGLDGSTHPDADDCAHAVLEGYVLDLSSDDRDALRFFQASTFLRLALVYALRPRWSGLAPQLTHLAGRCIDG